MTRTKSTIGIAALTLVACAGLSIACSSSDSTPPGGNAGAGGNGTAGNAGRAGSSSAGSSAAGAPAGGGSAGMSGGVAGSAGTGGAPNNCTRLPMNWLLTDFSPATIKGVSEGSSWNTGHDTLWGSSTSLTGGDVFYRGKPESAAKVTLHGETLTITASIAPGDYTGYMFNFGPKCTNASSTQGLQFDVGTDSTLGEATLKVQMQQRSDYPSTANPGSRPGDCMPTSVDTQYSECLSPATTVVSSGSTLTTGTVELPWTSFAGGKPVDALNNTELMAIQWQFECPSTGGKAPPVSADVVTNAGSGGISGGGSGGADPAANGGVSSGGSAGASAGSSGDSGSGGSGGSGGSAGSEAGSSGSGGSGGSSAGSGGSAGSAQAGSGGGTSTPVPCVVSFTIDNIKFY